MKLLKVGETIESVLNFHYKDMNKLDLLEDDLKTLKRESLKYSSEWISLSKKQKKKFPLGLVLTLDTILCQPTSDETSETFIEKDTKECILFIGYVGIYLLLFLIGLMVLSKYHIFFALSIVLLMCVLLLIFEKQF